MKKKELSFKLTEWVQCLLYFSAKPEYTIQSRQKNQIQYHLVNFSKTCYRAEFTWLLVSLSPILFLLHTRNRILKKPLKPIKNLYPQYYKQQMCQWYGPVTDNINIY